MMMNEAAPEGTKTVLAEGDDVKSAVAKAAAELGVPASSVLWELDKSWFRNELGGVVARDTLRLVAWARSGEEVEAINDAVGWVTTLLGHLELEGEVTATLQGKGVRVVVDVKENAGRLVGRRGRTLQAVAHLLNMAVGPDHSEYSFKVDVQDRNREERGDDDRGERRGRDRDRGDRRGRDRDRDRGDRRGRGRDRDRDERDVKKLKRMAQKILERVARTRQAEVVRKELNAYDRRMVHLEASEHPSVATRSIGEGSMKQIEFYPVDDQGNEVFGGGEE